jgi:hypothetical protein
MAVYLGACADAELVPFGPAARESRNEPTESESDACQLSGYPVALADASGAADVLGRYFAERPIRPAPLVQ